MAGSAKTNKWLQMAVSLLCIFTPPAIMVPWGKITQASEFSQYYAAGQAMHNGTFGQIYTVPFFVPPIISWLFYPLGLLKQSEAAYLWLFILAVSTLMTYFIICRFLNLRGTKSIWVALLLGTIGPLSFSIKDGALTPILLFCLIGLYVNLKKRNFLLASLYQSFLWLQPQLVLPLLCFELGLGQTYTVIVSILMAIIGCLVSCLLGGMHIVDSWSMAFLKYIHDWSSSLNECTFQGQLLRFSVHGDPVKAIAIAVYSGFLVATFILGKRVRLKEWHLSTALTVLVPLSICLAMRSANNLLLLLFPGMLFLILSPLDGWLKYMRALLIMGSFIILFLPFYMLINCGAIENSIANPFFWLTIIFAIFSLVLERPSISNSAGID